MNADIADLLDWNHALLDAWQALAFEFLRPGRPPFGEHVGPHLRHVVEHHDALLFAREPGCVRYDDRARDADVQRDPARARREIARLQRRVRQRPGDRALSVVLRCGTAGERVATVASTFGRELLFVGSHAVHHFAVVVDYCRVHAIPLPADAGMAPATVAHERARRSLHVTLQETA